MRSTLALLACVVPSVECQNGDRLRGISMKCATQPELAACVRLRSWYHANCSGFYTPHRPVPMPQGSPVIAEVNARLLLPQTSVLEDFCKYGGITSRDSRVHTANELYLVHPLRLAWVVNRKAASSTITVLLKTILSLFSSTDKGRSFGCDTGKASNCRQFSGRECSSLCLTNRTVQDYFFFAFVRDPISRFYSGLSTIMGATQGSAYAGNPSQAAEFYARNNASMVVRLLNNINSGDCGYSKHGSNQRFNIHLETQAMVLSTPLKSHGVSDRDNRKMVPLDYIGRVEHLEEDFLEMLEFAASTTGLSMSENQRATFRKVLPSAHLNSHLEKKRSLDLGERLRSPWLDSLVARNFAQDLVCFPRWSLWS